VGVIAELAEHPGGQHHSQAGLAQVDPGRDVLAKGRAYLLSQHFDLLAERGDHLGQRGHRSGVGGGELGGLGQLRGAQRRSDLLGPALHLAAAGSFQRGGDLRLRQPGGTVRIGGGGQQLQGIGGVQVSERRQRGREVLPKLVL